MSGRGKGGEGLGKGGTKRHRKVLRDNIQGITNPAIRRLARRGGVKRISGLIYEETRGVLKVFLENMVRDAVTYTEHARRKTVNALDVVHALKRQGRTLYGFDDPPTRRVQPSFDIHTLRKLTVVESAAVQQLRDALAHNLIRHLTTSVNTTHSIDVSPGSLIRLGLTTTDDAIRTSTGTEYQLNDDTITAYFNTLRFIDKRNAYLSTNDYQDIEDEGRKGRMPSSNSGGGAASSAAAAAAQQDDDDVVFVGAQQGEQMTYEQKVERKASQIVRRRYPDIHTKERILVPVNFNEWHWVLFVIRPKQFTIEFYDPMAKGWISPDSRRARDKVRDLASALMQKVNHPIGPAGWTVVDSSTEIQVNDCISCGVYTCMMAHAIGVSRGKADLNKLKNNALYYRRKMAAVLMTHGQIVAR